MSFLSFRGRVTRRVYFLHSLVDMLSMVLLAVAVYNIAASSNQVIASLASPLSVVVVLLVLADEISITVRRLHDLDRPGYHYFLLFVPLYNIVLGFSLLTKLGKDQPNRYDEGYQTPTPTPGARTTKPRYICTGCGSDINLGEPFCAQCGQALEYRVIE